MKKLFNVNVLKNLNSVSKRFFSGKNMKIYTKTGDMGTSSLLGGMRKNKDDEIFEILGDMDELNSYLGVVSNFNN